jgi:hypothetical protein
MKSLSHRPTARGIHLHRFFPLFLFNKKEGPAKKKVIFKKQSAAGFKIKMLPTDIPYIFFLQVMGFPDDDIEVNLVPRKIRTIHHVLPEEP